jgi:hypothetical protein
MKKDWIEVGKAIKELLTLEKDEHKLEVFERLCKSLHATKDFGPAAFKALCLGEDYEKVERMIKELEGKYDPHLGHFTSRDWGY